MSNRVKGKILFTLIIFLNRSKIQFSYLPLAVAGDKLSPVGGPVDEDSDGLGVVGVIANEL